MRRLFITDIHANLPAFDAVLRDAGSVDEIVFLGDAVGYGPHPGECVDLLKVIGAHGVRGNHDVEVLADPTLPRSDFAHAIWRRWTYQALSPACRDYLAGLPETTTIESRGQSVVVRHSTPSGRYLHPAMPDEMLAGEFRGVTGNRVYCGHSHRLIDRTVSGRRFVCLRAVGQSRDGDPRAGYAIEEDGALRHRSVEYDWDRVLRDLAPIGLPGPFLARWAEFVRTAHDPQWSRGAFAGHRRMALP